MPFFAGENNYMRYKINIRKKQLLAKHICLSFLTVLLVAVIGQHAMAQNQQLNKVDVQSFGISPNSGVNIVPKLRSILEKYKDQPLYLSFPKGRYDLWPDQTKRSSATIAFLIEGMKNVTIDGNGASFIFHGKMQPFLIKNSSNVILKNFSVDWQRPYISQGVIENISSTFVDLRIDKEKYPYKFEVGKLVFIGEGWTDKLTDSQKNLHNLYDGKTREILYHTRDNPLGDVFLGEAKEIENGLIRFSGKPKMMVPVGTYATLFHGRYISPGINITYSKDVEMQDVTLYHVLSHGFLGSRSENISIIRSSLTVNEKEGRVFSGVADASHFVNCKGTIKTIGSKHAGMGDDFLNCHGAYVKVLNKVNDHTLETGSAGRYKLSYTDVGDEIYLVDSVSQLRQNQTLTIVRIDTLKAKNGERKYHIVTKEQIPANLKGTYFLENKTWAAALEIRNCEIGRKHRARGILVSTPKAVVIEDNYFKTAGAAILIEGDLDYWYESGGVKNVVIKNNIFDNCHSSAPGWGKAVITITPSIKPNSVDAKPYHENVLIENNKFIQYDSPVLFARSVGRLQFLNNKVERGHQFVPFSKSPAFFLDGCRETQLISNRFSDDVLSKAISYKNMRPEDIKTDLKEIKPSF